MVVVQDKAAPGSSTEEPEDSNKEREQTAAGIGAKESRSQPEHATGEERRGEKRGPSSELLDGGFQ